MFNQKWQNLRLLFKYSIKRATKTINQPLLLKTDLSPSLFIYDIVNHRKVPIITSIRCIKSNREVFIY